VDRQQILLAKSLEAAEIPLRVATFDERLILQKTIYILQSAGIQIGYRYRWHLKGPYSSDMASGAFGILREGEAAQDELRGWCLDNESIALIEKLKPLLAVGTSKQEQARRLELLGSALYLIRTEQVSRSDHESLTKILVRNGKKFSTDEVRNAVKELRSYGLLTSGQ
jgi:uncharacterized protein YwgA